MGDEMKQPDVEAQDHGSLCHTQSGHAVPDGCTDDEGNPLKAGDEQAP